MPIHRKRFRIEETFNGDMPIPAAVGGDIGPMHREIMPAFSFADQFELVIRDGGPE
jgi:hypothetical protein